MEGNARFGRILRIRSMQHTAAQMKLAKSEEALREAEAITRQAQDRLEEVADDASVKGDFSVEDLMESRARVAWEARRLKEASHSEVQASSKRNEHARASQTMALKVRQAESMNDAALIEWQAFESRLERIRTDELSSRRKKPA